MDGKGSRKRTYSFGEHCLDPDSRTVISPDGEIHLAARPFDVLTFLIENSDRAVSRNELLDRFWDGHDVYDDALRKCIGAIRKALKDTGKPPKFIETRYGGGYRFVAEVEFLIERSSTLATSHLYELPPDGHDSSTEFSSLFVKAFSLVKPIPIFASVCFLMVLTLGFYFVAPRQQSAASAGETSSTLSRIRSIAVLPLDNLTGDAGNEYFSDGVTESLISELARINELKVISRSSTFSLKGKTPDPKQIGTQLGVDALLEGSVQKRGEYMNIRVRLVDARDGHILWTSNDFEREISAAYDLQDAIACNVAAELRTELCGAFVNRKTSDGLAYQEYLKGRYEWNKRTAAGIKKSIEHYQRAIAIDPNYALAYSGLSESYLQGIWHVPFNSNEVLPKALENALTAVKLDDASAEAHTALASVYSLQWKWDDSDRELARAIELNPRYARAYHTQAFGFMIKGRFDESLASIDRAAELDPLNLVISTDKANLLLAAGQTAEAFRQWERTFAIDPNFIMAREHRLVAYEFVGNDAAALDENAALMQARGETKEKIAQMRSIGSRSGFVGVRQAEYSELLTKVKRGENVPPVTMAIYFSLVGKRDEAFAWLERAVRERRAEIVLIVSPQFSGIHNDPRYPEMLKRIGLRN
ncbi:MAG: winged helix-turn-helix domain-containing protein [Pyrinomonadaceae bacterium]